MNYNDLSVEERIQKASEYAVILTSDERPDFDIIKEIKQTFDLDDEQAKQAYGLMRKNYNAEFQAGMRSKIRNGSIAVFISAVAAIFYAFIAGETGWPFLIVVFIFGGTAVQVILNIAKWYREKSVNSAEDIFSENERRAKLKQKGKDDLSTVIPVMLLFLLILTFFFFYKKNRVKNLNEISVINHLVVDQSVVSKSTGGKSPTHYLLFAFKGYSHKFRFEDNMYTYGKRYISRNDFKIGIRWI